MDFGGGCYGAWDCCGEGGLIDCYFLLGIIILGVNGRREDKGWVIEFRLGDLGCRH